MYSRAPGNRFVRRAAAFLGVVALTVLLGGCASADQSADVGPVPALSRDELERVKLAADIRSTQAKTGNEQSAAGRILLWAPFATALVAVAGAVFTLEKQRHERHTERVEQQHEETVERRKRHDDELARTVENLGSQDARVRLNTAAALTAYLGPDSPDLQLDLLALVIANLKMENDRDVADVLVHDLELALRACLKQGRPEELNLARTPWLKRLDIRDIDLTGIPVDLAYANLERADLSGVVAPSNVRGWEANLNYARLTGARLDEARFNNAHCVQTHFHKARLVSATFKGADLRRAQFQQAHLQGAHLERAQMQGANFTEANVADTWFCDAHHGNAADLDDEALRTLAYARNWRKAHFTPAQRLAVEAHADIDKAKPRYAARLVGRKKLEKAAHWYEKSLAAGLAVQPSALTRMARAFGAEGNTEGEQRWLAEAARLRNAARAAGHHA
ncbi:pentapeptide repeat-containing protein [Streptomyces sp. NPDC004520]|uniref:pentapeptide repeat-containing protein n=1 Tax=Streptomyces sp. NPDC004520 TaxID=3364702 RepID=UPI0036BB0B90